MIYFLRSGDTVKIGYAKHSSINRMKMLQTGNPVELEILGEMTGEIKEEKALQKRFWNLKIRGEWFKLSGALIKFINEQFAPKPHDLAIDVLRGHPEIAAHIYEEYDLSKYKKGDIV